MYRWNRPFLFLLAALLLSGLTLQVTAFVEPPEADKAAGSLESLAFTQHDLQHPDAPLASLNDLPAEAAAQAYRDLTVLGIDQASARIDARSGRFETLLPSHRLLSARTPVGQDDTARAAAARQAFEDFLVANRQELRIDPAELGEARTAVHSDGTIVQLHLPREVDGVPVEGSFISAVINHGKLNLMSTYRWADVDVPTRPGLSVDEALRIATDHVSPNVVDGSWSDARLVILPTHEAQGGFADGYGHRLVWELHPTFPGSLGSWEVRVDAHSGEVVSFEDTNHYAEAKGGVYPVTNDGVVPDGVEQPGWPMPWMTVSTSGGNVTSDTGGNFAGSGSFTASLTGPFVRMNDNCGASSLTQTGGLDFGASGGDDCVTPGFGGAGNTHSSRSGFYELNRIKETGRAQLPSNNWLTNQLTANMNINNNCNAFWNGSTVNFYRSGGGCANTGEIAGVFVHEWGHGMDANDVNGGIASPSGEGIADIYTALRLNDSCIGRNFLSSPCSGNGDPCITCTGVRDIDYLQRQSGNPHDYSWSNANCGGSVHCVGGVYSEAVWSLWKRILPAAPYNMDPNTAHELVTRLTYIGAGATSTWFSGGPPNGGCSGSSGYMNYLAADDDDGNLNNGTPHMQAIFRAFDDQEIACGSPTVQDSGCSGTPTVRPNVTATPGDNQVALSWGSVSGATEYQVFRAEGIFACDFGKVKVAETTGTSFTDTNLQNGRDYSYVVIPIGGNDSCMGPASTCDTVQPAGVPPVPDFSVSCSPSSLSQQPGGSSTSICTVEALNGYSGTVNLSCSGNPSGVSCSFSPSSVSPTGNSTLTVTSTSGQATGNFSFDVVGNDGTDTRTDEITLAVLPEGACLHEVDFESGAGGWTNGADTCSTGSFVVGVPDATAWQVGGGNPGNAFFTAPNPGGIGTNDVDGGTCEALSPVVNASSQAAVEVSLDYFHGQRDAGDDANDGFTIEVLNNGSVVDTLVAIGDVTNNPAWTNVSTTVNNPGNIQVRVRATDAAGPGDIVEGGVDNISVCPAVAQTCTVDEDFENGSAGWVNDAASTCTTGAYVTGNPTNATNGFQIVGSNSGVSSIFTATNSSAGVNDVDGGNCILSSPTWAVGSNSTLSVWYWHGQRDAGDDANGDFFRLEYSTDGGSTWSTLASNGDSTSNPAWTNATAQIASGSNVELRVQCSDGAGPGDLVECGIDDVSICSN